MRPWLVVFILAAVAAVGVAVYQSEETPPQPADRVELVRADYAAIDRAVTEKKGLVVLVDFWATTCGPCRAKFPHFVALHERYAGDGLVCISVCYDPDPEDRDAALRMLRGWRATMRNFHFLDRTRGDRERMRERFGIAGYLPHAVLFARSGERGWDSMSSALSEAALEQLIVAELEKK